MKNDLFKNDSIYQQISQNYENKYENKQNGHLKIINQAWNEHIYNDSPVPAFKQKFSMQNLTENNSSKIILNKQSK